MFFVLVRNLRMAQANIQLIEALRETAARLRNGAAYAWGNHGACNCGNLTQVVTKLTKEEILAYAHTGIGEWTELAEDYCGVTNAPAGLLISKLQEIGLTPSDIHNLEYLEDKAVLQQLPGVLVNVDVLAQGQLRGDAASRQPVSPAKPCLSLEPTANVPVGALIKRDWAVLWGNPQAVLWGALFHWMVLSFFGIGLGKPSIEFAQVAVWVSALLAVLLGAKDWFSEDHRVGWLRLLANIHPTNIGVYWLLRVLCTALAQILVLVPVTGLLALQFGLTGQQAMQLMLGLVAGVWAMAPLLGVIALLVMLTRGGAVLVYLIALPLMVPVLIFGLEASRAADFGRSASAPLAVMFSMGLLACLVGPALSRRLIQLIQE